jgi:flagellar FliL protein
MAEQAETASKEGPAPKQSSKLVPALIGINTLALVGVVAFVLMRPSGSGRSGAAGEGGGKAPGEHGEAATPGQGEKGAEGRDKKGPAKKGHASSAPEDMPGPMLRLPDFVVHLRNSDADRYARMSFEVEVDTDEDKNRLTALMPAIRDNFIAYLSDRTIEELRGSEAISRTKVALTGRLQQVAPTVGVRALYLTDLVIQ